MSIQSLILIRVDRFALELLWCQSVPHSSVKGIVHSSSLPHGSSQKPRTRRICFLSNLLNTLEGWHGARDKYYLRTFTNTLQFLLHSFTFPLSCWSYFTPSSWSSLLSNTSIRVNIQPTLRNSGQEETETCLRWPLLSFLCFFFAGSPPFLTGQYYILHRTVAFGFLAFFYYTITLPTSWPS